MKTPSEDCSFPGRNSNQVPRGCTREEGTPANCGGGWQVSPAHVRSHLKQFLQDVSRLAHDRPSCRWTMRRGLDAWRPLAPWIYCHGAKRVSCGELPDSQTGDPGSVPGHMGFMVDKVAPAGCLRILRSSPVNPRSTDFCILISQWAHQVHSSLTPT
jgi:hypothetical protein